MSELTIEQRVAAGAAWLDQHRPGWIEEIDVVELDMDSCYMCILGQLYGQFWDAPLSSAPKPMFTFEMSNYLKTAAPLGFSYSATVEEAGEEYERLAGADLEALAAEWRRVIESRRAES